MLVSLSSLIWLVAFLEVFVCCSMYELWLVLEVFVCLVMYRLCLCIKRSSSWSISLSISSVCSEGCTGHSIFGVTKPVIFKVISVLLGLRCSGLGVVFWLLFRLVRMASNHVCLLIALWILAMRLSIPLSLIPLTVLIVFCRCRGGPVVVFGLWSCMGSAFTDVALVVGTLPINSRRVIAIINVCSVMNSCVLSVWSLLLLGACGSDCLRLKRSCLWLRCGRWQLWRCAGFSNMTPSSVSSVCGEYSSSSGVVSLVLRVFSTSSMSSLFLLALVDMTAPVGYSTVFGAGSPCERPLLLFVIFSLQVGQFGWVLNQVLMQLVWNL